MLVLIVGAGPIGLVLSMILTKFGTSIADYNFFSLPLSCGAVGFKTQMVWAFGTVGSFYWLLHYLQLFEKR